jgi:hypothetical protein
VIRNSLQVLFFLEGPTWVIRKERVLSERACERIERTSQRDNYIQGAEQL